MQASMIDERACTSRSREPGVSRSTGAGSRFDMRITSGCTSCCCIVLCLATFPYDFVDLQSSPLPASLTCTIEGSTVGTLCVAACLLPVCNVRHDQWEKERSAPACRLLHNFSIASGNTGGQVRITCSGNTLEATTWAAGSVPESATTRLTSQLPDDVFAISPPLSKLQQSHGESVVLPFSLPALRCALQMVTGGANVGAGAVSPDSMIQFAEKVHEHIEVLQVRSAPAHCTFTEGPPLHCLQHHKKPWCR